MGRKSKMQAIETSPFQASPELSQALFEQATDSIFITTAQDRYLEVNQRGCELLGCSRAELLQLSWEDVIPTEELTHDSLCLDDWVAAKTGLAECRLRSQNGRLLTVEISLHKLADGRLLAFVHDLNERKQTEKALLKSIEEMEIAYQQSVIYARELRAEIVERRQAQAALAENQRRLQALFDNTQNAILLVDDSMCYVDANPAACALLGYSREEILQKTVLDSTPKPNQSLTLQVWQTLVSERLYLLREIDADILVAQSPTAIVQTTLKRLHQLIPCERVSVTLFDFEAQEAVVFAAEVSQDSPVQIDLRQPLDPDWIATLKHSQTLVVEDTLVLVQPTPLAKILMATGVRSYMND